MFKNISIRKKILIAMIVLIVFCGVAVLASAIFLFTIEAGDLQDFVLSEVLITGIVLMFCILVAIYVSDIINQQMKKMMKDINERDKLLQAVNQAAASLLDYNEHEDIKPAILAGLGLIGSSLCADRTHIWRCHIINDDVMLEREYTWHSDAAKKMPPLPGELIQSRDFPNLEWNDRHMSGEIVSGLVSKMPRGYREFLGVLKVKSIAIIPMFVDEQLWGFFNIDICTKERDFSGDEISILQPISLMMASAIQRNKLIMEMDEVNKRLMLMLDSSPLCAQIWDKNLNTVDCNMAGVKLYGFEDKYEYLSRFLTCCSPEHQPDGERSDTKMVNLVKRAFDEGYCEFDWVHLVPGDSSLMPAEVTLVRVELGNDDVVIGYTRDMREKVKLERKIFHLETDKERAYLDGLTSIHNRLYFDESIDRVVKSLARSGGMLSLMMIDIDCFKQYNDTYGHSAGDECLTNVAVALSESVLRPDDFVARYGGEEFVVVLPNTDENGARAIADKIIENVIKLEIPHEKNTASSCVTISLGVTTGKVEQNMSVEYIINIADNMLYKSKKNGRNQYTFSAF